MSHDETPQTEIYSGGFHALATRFERKQVPLAGASEILPPADADLAALSARIVPPPAMPFKQAERHTAQRKYLEFQRDFEGQSEILLLHAFLIATLRRSQPPDRALPLFLRLWGEQGARLAKALPVRWLVSAATTFADHGNTPGQRACGMGLSVMFDMIKLHDSERRFSGKANDVPFNWLKAGRQIPLAFDMSAYALVTGDLDKNMLARLWKLGEEEPVIQPLARQLLHLVNCDDRTVFARIQTLKRRANLPDDKDN